MHPVLFFESFFFCSREDLERLQPLSQSLLDMIVAGSNVLPLRPIHRVEMDSFYPEDKIRIFVEVHGRGRPDYEASVLDGDFAETFRHLQHTCIKCINVEVKIRDTPFLRYWKAQETACFTVVSIEFPLPEGTDYDVLDSIVNHLRPRTTTEVDVHDASWRENGRNSEYLEALARDSFLNNLQICRLIVYESAFPPSGFFLNEPGYRNYEVWCFHSKAANGIDGFIESFVRDGCANMKLESVSVTWEELSKESSPVLEQLGKPMKMDMPLPKIDLTAEITCDIHEVSQREMHFFVNPKQRKRMDVFKWRAEYVSIFGRRHTSHVLQCRVTNL